MRWRNVPLPAADDHYRCSTLTNGKLCQNWFSSIAIQVKRHHFYCLLIAARNPCRFSTFSTFSIFRFLIAWLAIHQHLLTTMTSRHQPLLNMDDPKHRSLYSQVDSHVAALASLSLPFGPTENKSLASCPGAGNAASRDGMRATGVLIGQYVCSIAVALPRCLSH